MKNIKLRSCLLLIFCLAPVSAAARAQTIIKRPEQAAQNFYAAWQKKNKTLARKAAREEAVEKLFGVRRQKMTFKGCAKREEGDYECLYENKRLDLTTAMIVKIYRAGGYRVAEVSFSSEAY